MSKGAGFRLRASDSLAAAATSFLPSEASSSSFFAASIVLRGFHARGTEIGQAGDVIVILQSGGGLRLSRSARASASF